MKFGITTRKHAYQHKSMNIRWKKKSSSFTWNTLYCSLFKIKPGKRLESQTIKDFQAKLELTMPFWLRNVEKKMIGNNKNKSQNKKEAVEEDILFLKSMKTVRTAQYSTRNTVTERIEEN